MRQTKMVEWMENVEKAISRIMADKVYTSAEFKRERDNFHVSTSHIIYSQKICQRMQFDETMHCLSQRLKSTFFEKFWRGGFPKLRGLWSEEKMSKNVDFNL